MTEFLFAAYLVIGLLVYIRALRFFDEKNKDADPEGLDAMVALAAGLFWPLTIPVFVICNIFRG
jgi:O-methyltransferase involved in polyketide biosynthesis